MPPETDLFILAGPTASGKTDLALSLAEKHDAEIVNVDAYQVYCDLPILTAAPTLAQRELVPHHLVGILDATSDLNAVDYAALAQAAMADIRRRGRRILLVGGSGFYLEALLGSSSQAPPPDATIRREVEQLTPGERLVALQQIDPSASAAVDLQNPRRVQRALEIVRQTGKPFAHFAPKPLPPVCGAVLELPRELLHKRIIARVDTMLALGAIDEVRRFDATGPCGKTAAHTLGLNEIRLLLRGAISRDECREKIIIATRQYAKRQLTWFRNRSPWPWLPPEKIEWRTIA